MSCWRKGTEPPHPPQKGGEKLEAIPSNDFVFLSHGYDLHIDNELVAAAFAELPQQAQSILILHCVLEMADGEIGALMGMSRSAVQRHRTKTLKELRTKLMALNAHTVLRGAPTSMGRGESPVELMPSAVRFMPISPILQSY